jgi:hypothetical protein
VSAAIAPILGGTTRADPSDLIALAVLVPVYVWLGRDVPTLASDSAKEGDALAAARRVLIACSFLVTVLAVTATSCAEPGSCNGSSLWVFVPLAPVLLVFASPLMLIGLARQPGLRAVYAFLIALLSGITLGFTSFALYMRGEMTDSIVLAIAAACVALFSVALALAIRRRPPP